MDWNINDIDDAIHNAEKGNESITALFRSEKIIEQKDIDSFRKELANVFEESKNKTCTLSFLVCDKLKLKNIQAIKDFIDNFQNLETLAEEHNTDRAKKEIWKISELISPVEGKTLDEQQLLTISSQSNRKLVIAGAGTGKTTTIIGLAKYLYLSGKATAEEMLFLSYTRATVNELSLRLRKELGFDCYTYTFHQLGRRIIAMSENRAPNLTQIDMRSFILDRLNKMMADKTMKKSIQDYILREYRYSHDEYDFNKKEEYRKYIEENPLITYRGESVKSHGEADIANFLYRNGIDYEYEKPYLVDTTDSRYRKYLPDFHIKGTNIYIEYLGLDRNGNVAPFMQGVNGSEHYVRQLLSKRKIHEKFSTVLIEAYSFERWEGKLYDKLENELKKHDVKFSPIDDDLLFKKMVPDRNRIMDLIAGNIETAIKLLKGTGLPFDEAFPKGKTIWENITLDRFSKILEPIFNEYQKTLNDSGDIDFEDMLSDSVNIVDSGKWKNPYRYIIVDEYQDISNSKISLLKALMRSNPCNLYCVGDDWQSIYRFNGGDVGYILNFSDIWGISSIFKIENTYRFSGDILTVSNRFMSNQKRQTSKKLKGFGSESKVRFIHGYDSKEITKNITKVLDLIPDDESVMFLGRKNSDVASLDRDILPWDPKPSAGYTDIWYNRKKNLKIRFRTIHNSKGLETDHVFILNNKQGVFPLEIPEPSAIRRMMQDKSPPLNEERRLMYVAMTRARKSLNFIVPDGEESQFIKEIQNFVKDPNICPLCGGRMIERNGKYGSFYGCSNYSKGCKYTCGIDDLKLY